MHIVFLYVPYHNVFVLFHPVECAFLNINVSVCERLKILNYENINWTLKLKDEINSWRSLINLFIIFNAKFTIAVEWES